MSDQYLFVGFYVGKYVFEEQILSHLEGYILFKARDRIRTCFVDFLGRDLHRVYTPPLDLFGRVPTTPPTPSSVIPPGTVLQAVSSYALAPHDMLELSIRLLGITKGSGESRTH